MFRTQGVILFAEDDRNTEKKSRKTKNGSSESSFDMSDEEDRNSNGRKRRLLEELDSEEGEKRSSRGSTVSSCASHGRLPLVGSMAAFANEGSVLAAAAAFGAEEVQSQLEEEYHWPSGQGEAAASRNSQPSQPAQAEKRRQGQGTS